MATGITKRETSAVLKESFIEQLESNNELFWANMRELKPKDFCEMYLKACQYIMPKAGSLAISPPGSTDTIQLEETKRKVNIIRGGLPTEDVEEEPAD